MLEEGYYEVIAPKVWQKADSYKEYAYEEEVEIISGRGTCKSEATAGMLERLGYKVIHHKPVEVVKDPNERQEATDETLVHVETDSD